MPSCVTCKRCDRDHRIGNCSCHCVLPSGRCARRYGMLSPDACDPYTCRFPTTGLMPYVMPARRDCWPLACLSRRSATNWGTRTPTARGFMPRSISSASVRWPISTWEVSYEPPTPDRAVHFLSTVAWIIIHHGCDHSPGFRPCPWPASQRCQCSVRHVDAFLGKARPVTRTWFTKLSSLAVLLPICREPWLHHHAPLPTVMPKRPPAFVPYIYTREEIRRLLRVIESHPQEHQPGAGDDPHDDSGVLWGRLASARGDKPDSRRRGFERVGPDDSEHEVRQDATGSRGTATEPGLGSVRPHSADETNDRRSLFHDAVGRPVKPDTLQHNFRILCDRAGIRRT